MSALTDGIVWAKYGELAIEKGKRPIRPLGMPVHRTFPKRCYRGAPKSSMPFFVIELSSIHVGFVWLALGFAELAFPPPWKFRQDIRCFVGRGVLVLGQIENYSQRYRKLHLQQEKNTPKPTHWH